MENTNNNILEIKNLHTYFYTDSGVIKSVDGVDISPTTSIGHNSPAKFKTYIV